ncbi:hypothetical protein AAXE64_27045 [Priestia megaterium]
MDTEKYYFISYKWTRPGLGKWESSNRVSKVHPLVWLKDMIDNFEDTYRIEFYDEISKEHYDLVYGWID